MSDRSDIMKTLAISSFFVLFALVMTLAVTPDAYADHTTASISAPAGTSAPGCETTNECFIPASVSVDVGGEVTWSNDDTAAHTVTSGTAGEGPDGNFDSSLFMAGTTFSWTATEAGEYPYFCMVHPWMIGTVIVEAEAAEEPAEEVVEEVVEEVELTVTITDSAVDGGVQVDLLFNQEHVNYEIIATQDGNEVLKESGHAHEDMMGSHTISVEASDENPVDVSVVSLGIGLPGEDWTGPTGEIASQQVVPEFGTIAMIILAVSIMSIIAVTAKSKVIPRM